MRTSTLSLLSVPRFESRFTFTDGSDIFQELGIGKILRPGGLSNLTVPRAEELPMEIIQKTVFKIDEIGAEGASETHFGAATFNSGGCCTPRSFVLDQPFIYIVEEYSTSSILFTGSHVKF